MTQSSVRRAASTAPGGAVPLSLADLDALDPRIARPGYRRDQLTAGILHLGVGNFHRAHMAVYLDDLFNQGLGRDFAITGAGVTSHDAAMRQRLSGQDWLSTVVEQDGDGAAARITGVMTDYIAPEDRSGLIAALADPAIRIVSLTITEGGYFIDATTGKFDAAHSAIVADAANPDDPRTVFGLILAGLKRRRAAGVPPFTVMSCDNVPHNGAVTRNALAGLARLFDAELADYVAAMAFPNGMVDRITPATGDRERAQAESQFGVIDASPVFCEPFRQWVLEDNFPLGRPPLEKAGVTFVKDVTPWENMKIRILNGGHAVIAYPAGLLGITFVDEAMAHPLIAAFLDKVEREEIIPQVAPVPDTQLTNYLALIARRFANPKVGDTVRRLCLDGSNRQPKFIIPSIADNLRNGGLIDGLALESALWCRYCAGVTEAGEMIADNDPQWERLKATARAAQANPDLWLDMADIYGATGKDARLRAAFRSAMASLAKHGVEGALRAYLAG